MSIKAKISKTLVIDSPQKLHETLEYYSELLDQSIELKIFMDQMNLSIQGCQCDFFDAIAEVMDMYVDLYKIKDDTKKSMKALLNCDKIIFYSKGTKLFEF